MKFRQEIMEVRVAVESVWCKEERNIVLLTLVLLQLHGEASDLRHTVMQSLLYDANVYIDLQLEELFQRADDSCRRFITEHMSQLLANQPQLFGGPLVQVSLLNRGESLLA